METLTLPQSTISEKNDPPVFVEKSLPSVQEVVASLKLLLGTQLRHEECLYTLVICSSEAHSNLLNLTFECGKGKYACATVSADLLYTAESLAIALESDLVK